GTASVRLFNPALYSHGWESSHTVLQMVNDDMPFLVDSVTMALSDLGVGVHVLGHPVVQVSRDRAGRLLGLGEGGAESMIHMEVDRQSPDSLDAIQTAVSAALEDVRMAVADWAPMREKMLQVAAELADNPLPVPDSERREAQEFLRWVASDHFTFLGYREYKVRKRGGEPLLAAVEGSGLGLMRGRTPGAPRPLKTLAAHEVRRS